jgi:hypothetical protein
MMHKKPASPETINFVQRFKGKCELIPLTGLRNMVADKNAKGIDISDTLISLKMISNPELYRGANFNLNNGLIKSHHGLSGSIDTKLPIDPAMFENKYNRKFYPNVNEPVIDQLKSYSPERVPPKNIQDLDRENWNEFKGRSNNFGGTQEQGSGFSTLDNSYNLVNENNSKKGKNIRYKGHGESPMVNRPGMTIFKSKQLRGNEGELAKFQKSHKYYGSGMNKLAKAYNGYLNEYVSQKYDDITYMDRVSNEARDLINTSHCNQKLFMNRNVSMAERDFEKAGLSRGDRNRVKNFSEQKL